MRFRLALLALVVAAAPAPAQQKPRKVAFLVGVGSYKHTLADLDGVPEKDVAALEKILTANGFTVHTLTGPKATKKAIEAKFKAVVGGDGTDGKALGKGDVVLVQLCMHGFTVEVGGKTEPYLAGYDARPEEPATLVALNDLIRTASPFGVTSLFLVDACRENNDPNRGMTRGVEGGQMTLPKNTAVLFSCAQGQLAYQPAALKHGLFTFAVLEALHGRTGLSGDITWADLVSHVGKAFESEALKKHIPAKKAQTPLAVQGETEDTKLFRLKAKPPVVMFDKLQLVGDEAQAHAAVLAGGNNMGNLLRGIGENRLDTWKAASAAGEVSAHYLVATAMLDGVGGTRDPKAAVALLEKAADAGYPWAMAELGRKYATGGAGVEKNEKRAYEWSRRGAAAGNPLAMNTLGQMYDSGFGAKADAAEAFKWYEKAAKAGHVEAMSSVGRCYDGGLGVATDYKAAAEWYEKAAAVGEPRAMNNLGFLYHHGNGVPQDATKALEWYQKAADLGNAAGMANVAFMYQNAVGVPRDYPKAMQLYEQSAKLGNARAMNSLGFLYQKGLGMKRADFEAAATWYAKAAEKGDAEGYNNLGYMTQHGHGVAKNEAAALDLYRKATAGGYAVGMLNLAYCYEHGVGTKTDLALAKRWYQKAAVLGNEDAKKAVQRLSK